MVTRTPNWLQQDYRFRKDDGSLSTATDYAADNTSASIQADAVFRLRLNIGDTNNANSSNTAQWKLQFSAGGGAWTDVGAATTIRYTTSSQGIADGTNEATQRLPVISGSAYASTYMEFDTANTLTSRTWADQYTEYEFCAKIAAGTAAGTSIQLRVVTTGGTVPTITNTPTLTVQAPSSTYNESVSESVAATDTTSGGLSLSDTVSESVSSSDTTSAAYTANASVAETTDVDDLPSATTVLSGSVSESTATSDSTSAGATTYNDTTSESAAATDTVTATVTIPVAVSESASTGDTQTTVLHAVGSISESAAATDSPSSQAVLTNSVSESVIATDSQSAPAPGGSAEVYTTSGSQVSDTLTERDAVSADPPEAKGQTRRTD